MSFNSRTPGGVRLEGRRTIINAVDVSIHAPREGCDEEAGLNPALALGFQFTHPGRGATVWCKVAYYGADKQA